jgi:hypothetical protein
MTAFALACLMIAAPTPKGAAPETPATKAKAALEEVGNVVVENKSLTDFVAFVKARTRLDVQLDGAALGQTGMDPNMPQLSVNARDVPFREAVDAALAPIGLKIGAVGGVLVISTEDGLIVKQMRQKVGVSTGTAGEIFAKLRAKTGANIVIDPRQKQKIAEATCELDLTDVTLETAVRLVAEVAGYRAIRMGNILYVTTNERAKELRPDADGPTQPGTLYPLMSGGLEVPLPGPVPNVAPAAPAPPQQ